MRGLNRGVDGVVYEVKCDNDNNDDYDDDYEEGRRKEEDMIYGRVHRPTTSTTLYLVVVG